MNAWQSTLALVRLSRTRRSWIVVALEVVASTLAAFAASHVLQGSTIAIVATIAGASVSITHIYRARGRERPNDVTYLSAPLYGRELARGLAIGPCLAGIAIPLGALIGMDASGRTIVASLFLVAIAACAVATLVALTGSLRDGLPRRIYAIVAGTIAVAVATIPLIGQPGALIAIAAALLIGYAALRSFSETLARYDLIEV